MPLLCGFVLGYLPVWMGRLAGWYEPALGPVVPPWQPSGLLSRFIRFLGTDSWRFVGLDGLAPPPLLAAAALVFLFLLFLKIPATPEPLAPNGAAELRRARPRPGHRGIGRRGLLPPEPRTLAGSLPGASPSGGARVPPRLVRGSGESPSAENPARSRGALLRGTCSPGDRLSLAAGAGRRRGPSSRARSPGAARGRSPRRATPSVTRDTTRPTRSSS